MPRIGGGLNFYLLWRVLDVVVVSAAVVVVVVVVYQ